MIIHQLDGYIQTIYLIEYPDKLLLLDGCSRADIDLVTYFINKTLNRPLSDLQLIVVSHMHPDHAGGAAKLRKLTRCKIATAKVSGHWYRGIDGVLMHWTDIVLAQWVAKRKKRHKRSLWYRRKLIADIYLDDQEYLPGFDDWQVLFTQGHTDRDLSLSHHESQKIYIADVMVKVKSKFIPPFPIFYPNRYKATLNKLKALTGYHFLLAHGGEVQLSNKDFKHLFSKAPQLPATHWRSVKTKFSKAILSFRGTPSN